MPIFTAGLKPFQSFSSLILGEDVVRDMAWRGRANLEAIGRIPNIFDAEVSSPSIMEVLGRRSGFFSLCDFSIDVHEKPRRSCVSTQSPTPEFIFE